MKLGHFYETNQFHWLVYPTKSKTALRTYPNTYSSLEGATYNAAHQSKTFDCDVFYIAPNVLFIALEQDHRYYKILTAYGTVGWIYVSDVYADDINELKTEAS